MNRTKRITSIWSILLASPLFLIARPPFTQSVSDYTPARVDRAGIRLDGILDEPVWRSITPIPFFSQLCPDAGRPPSEKTEMRLVYDKDFIYVGIRCHEKDPANIVSRTMERDSQTFDQDGIGFIIDTLNDHRTAYGFIISPGGVRTDIAVTNDGETQEKFPWNVEWNAFWDAAASRDKEGWTAEMKIPFSSLRYEMTDGAAEMGIILWRYLARNKEFDIFPAIPNNWRFSAFKPSLALDVKFKEIGRQHPLYIRPYVLGGFNQQNEPDASDAAVRLQKTWKHEIGLDIKYNLTPGLIFDGTLNTDFAQVETDDQQINLTRFSLLYPEKRSFFQERVDLFSFKVPGAQQNLFYSRTIGIVDEIPVAIRGGVRLAGRLGNWDVGLLEMQTEKAEVNGVPYRAQNYGVFRLKRKISRDDSYIGAMVTSRADFKGQTSLLGGIDSDIHLTGPHYLQMQIAQSFEPGSVPSKSRYASLIFTSRIQRGFTYALSTMHLGGQFNPALGFLFQNGINRVGSRIGYNWFPKSSNVFLNFGFSNHFEYIQNISANRLGTFSDSLNGDVVFKSGAAASFKFEFKRDYVDEMFSVGRVNIDPGPYEFWHGEAKYETSSGSPFHLKIETQVGGYYGGRQVGGTLSPYWTLNEYLTIAVDYYFSHIRVPMGVNEAHIVRIRTKLALNKALTLSAFTQYNSDIRQVSANIRLRFNPSEGQDLYLVINEGFDTGLDQASLRLPRAGNRAIMIKYSYTFIR